MGVENPSDKSIDHLRREEEAARIRYLGEVVLVAATMRSVYFGTTPENIERFQEEFRESFYGPKSTRNDRLRILAEQEETFKQLGQKFNQGANESSTAKQFRRLTLISNIVKAGLAEGNTAVDAVDLYMGNLGFDLQNISLVKKEQI